MAFVGSYLWKLRQKMGSQRLLVPGVAIILLNEDGHLWCGKREDGGEWSFFGGAQELGQSIPECLRQELLEETGIVLVDYRFVGVATRPEDTSYTYTNGDEVQIVNFIFEIHHKGPVQAADSEHTEVRAFPLDALPSPFKPDSLAVVAQYQRFLQTGMVVVD
jgi:8-oxo-dGTP pyrophosphatase MutT (NUDIX family)